jgi:hypothetical protein
MHQFLTICKIHCKHDSKSSSLNSQNKVWLLSTFYNKENQLIEIKHLPRSKEYFENKLENLEKMDKFLDTYDYPKLKQSKQIYNIQLYWSSITESPKKEKSITWQILCWILTNL